MKLSQLIGACLLSLPLIASATEIKITNNTNNNGVAMIGSMCSADIGDDGVLKAGKTLIVPQIVFDIFCSDTCEAKIYFGKNCNGQPFATAELSNNQGVTSVHNNYPELYKVSISDDKLHVTIDTPA